MQKLSLKKSPLFYDYSPSLLCSTRYATENSEAIAKTASKPGISGFFAGLGEGVGLSVAVGVPVSAGLAVGVGVTVSDGVPVGEAVGVTPGVVRLTVVVLVKIPISLKLISAVMVAMPVSVPAVSIAVALHSRSR